MRDRIRGVLIGLAAGDRNGGPVRMALRLAASLVECRRFDPDDVLARYVHWWQNGGFDTGPVAAHVFDRVAAGTPGPEAVEAVHALFNGHTAGCNPAHRAPPLAMAAFLPDESLADAARREAALTHRHELAGDAAAATVVLCRALVRGDDWDAALHRAALGDGPPSPGGFAPEVLRTAVHFVDAHADFGGALAAAVAFAGPANYCPVLAGALGGARWGAGAIPPDAVAHCDVLDEVCRAADAMADA